MTPRASVVIVSRGRPEALALALDALRYQSHPDFETIVVGDTLAEQGIARAGLGASVLALRCDVPNIAVARNIGLASARGGMVAFMDDDAIPEPLWLEQLESSLKATGASIAAGYVRGPDGLGFQFAGQWLQADATHASINHSGSDHLSLPPDPRRVAEAMGTNVAYNRGALSEIGGFDSGFAYYLDESDVNWRLGQAGHATVLVPRAQVWHRMLPSSYRSGARVPLSLAPHARSVGRFLRKHSGGETVSAIERHESEQRNRLSAAMLSGRIFPDQMSALLTEFRRVAETGRADPVAERELTSPHHAPASFPALGEGRPPNVARSIDTLPSDSRPATIVRTLAGWSKPGVSYLGDGIWEHRATARTLARAMTLESEERVGIRYQTG